MSLSLIEEGNLLFFFNFSFVVLNEKEREKKGGKV
jgi:hypothetical protein